MEQITLQASARTVSTKGALNAIRREGKVPAVMYNQHGKSEAIAVNLKEFNKLSREISESSIITLVINGKEHSCFVKDRQIELLTGKLMHIDFFEVEKNAVVHVRVPLHFVGTAPGIKLGGIFESPMHEIEVSALPADIPQHIEVDVSSLNVNESIHVKDIKVSERIKLLTAPDMVVATIKYAKHETAAAAEAAPAAETAPSGESAEKK